MKKNISQKGFFGRRRRPRIFISYRRSGEGAGYGGRLADKLLEYFGPSQCFRDVENIEMGVDFVKSITRAVDVCEILIVVIGPDWTTQRDKTGQPRLQNPKDFVRLEVAAALKRDIRVIPVLVGGAQVPTEDALPDDLKALSHRQAHELADTRWDYDVERLLEQIRTAGIKGRTPSERAAFWHRAKIGAAVVFTAAIAVAGMMLWSQLSTENLENPALSWVKEQMAGQSNKVDKRIQEAEQRLKKARLAEQRAREAEERARKAEQHAEKTKKAENRSRLTELQSGTARIATGRSSHSERQAGTARLGARQTESYERKSPEPRIRGVTGSVSVNWWYGGIFHTSFLQMDGTVGTAKVVYSHPIYGKMVAIHDLYFSDTGGRGFDYMLIGQNARPVDYSPETFALAKSGRYLTVKSLCDLARNCQSRLEVKGRFSYLR